MLDFGKKELFFLLYWYMLIAEFNSYKAFEKEHVYVESKNKTKILEYKLHL